MGASNQKMERPALFWSGGKDSFLALCYWRRAGMPAPLLVTTYDDESKMVPFQQIPIQHIYTQSVHLELPLLTIPVSYPASNREYIETLRQNFASAPFQITEAVFGDLHLQDIRDWREQQFLDMGIETHFPIWGKPPGELMDVLEQQPAEIRIRSVSEEYEDVIKPNDLFDRDFVQSLPDYIDPFGEKGEFHTEVVFVQ